MILITNRQRDQLCRLLTMVSHGELPLSGKGELQRANARRIAKVLYNQLIKKQIIEWQTND